MAGHFIGSEIPEETSPEPHNRSTPGATPSGNGRPLLTLVLKVPGCTLPVVAQYRSDVYSSLEHTDFTVMMDNEVL